MSWTQTDGLKFLRALSGLNPRNSNARPSAQETYEYLIALLDKATKAIHGKPAVVRDDQRADLRQLVDDLYRVQPRTGPPVDFVSWDYDEAPDMSALIHAINTVADGTVHAHEVDDGSQEYILAVSRQPLGVAEALAAWEASR